MEEDERSACADVLVVHRRIEHVDVAMPQTLRKYGGDRYLTTSTT